MPSKWHNSYRESSKKSSSPAGERASRHSTFDSQEVVVAHRVLPPRFRFSWVTLWSVPFYFRFSNHLSFLRALQLRPSVRICSCEWAPVDVRCNDDGRLGDEWMRDLPRGLLMVWNDGGHSALRRHVCTTSWRIDTPTIMKTNNTAAAATTTGRAIRFLPLTRDSLQYIYIFFFIHVKILIVLRFLTVIINDNQWLNKVGLN